MEDNKICGSRIINYKFYNNIDFREYERFIERQCCQKKSWNRRKKKKRIRVIFKDYLFYIM